MAKKACEVVVIQDKSGSMNYIREDTIGSFNTFVDEQKKLPGECYLTLVLFDTSMKTVHEAKPLEEVPPLDTWTFTPSGATALYDAVGETLERMIQRRKASKDKRKTMIVINTDGLENSSQKHSYEDIQALIKKVQDKYKWEVVYLGANQDAMKVGMGLGVRKDFILNFAHNSAGIRAAYASTSNTVREFRK